MMNYWIATLLSLSVTITETNGFALQRNFAASRLPGAFVRRQASLTLPYQVYDAEVEQHVVERPRIIHGDFPFTPCLPIQAGDEMLPECDAVALSYLPSNTNEETINKTPLVISPKSDKSVMFLSAFMHNNQQWLNGQLLKHGAILFRGFELDSAKTVENAIRSFEPNLNNNYRGTSPRNTVGGSDYVFSAAEVPSNYPIAQHLEMSFLPAPPRRLFFSALRAPKTIGGETALADFRQVYRDLPKRLREKLATKKLQYQRTHNSKGARFTTDVAAMQSWADVFGTSDKEEVERIAHEENMPMRWEGKNNDTFVSEFVSEPFQLHPETMEPVWFNHAQVFHWTTFPAELFMAFKRTREPRFLIRAFAIGLQSLVVHGLLRRKMSLHVSFGDGTPISAREMHQIRRAVHRNMVFNRWDEGDLLMIDNFSTSHGRQPTYDKGRKVVVAWSDPLAKQNLLAE